MEKPRILVVHRRSAYTDLVSEKRHRKMAELVKNRDKIVSSILTAHENHMNTLQVVKDELKSRKLDFVRRHRIRDVATDEFDLIITVGGDGTVLHTSHTVGATPIFAVNSSPTTSVGFLTGANAETFGERLGQVLSGAFPPATLNRMEIMVNGEVVASRALNDVLFCHDCPASTTRYVLGHNGVFEDQLSSGVWVSTAVGSTAAIQSAGGKVMSPRSKRLQFVVREPFPSGGAADRVKPALTRGFVSHGEELMIRSKTEAARLYIDGPHVVFPVDFGDRVTFCMSSEPLNLFGYNKEY